MTVPEYTLLAKQPVYGADKHCVAHELLFRSPLDLKALDVGPDLATNQVLVNYCASVAREAEKLSGPVFINVDATYVKSHSHLPVAPDRVVIELNRYDADDEELLDSVDSWRAAGFRFALDDVDLSAPPRALLSKAEFAKVDVLDADWAQLPAELSSINDDTIQWVAKRIEDEATYERSRAAGFDHFQGYFLARPKEITGQSIRPGTAVTIRLISALDRPGITMDEIAQLVGQDPKLAVQMLKIINSSLFSLPQPVGDIKSALVFMGVDTLRQWALMIAFLSNGNVHVQASRYVLHRAKAMELLSMRVNQSDDLAATAFLTGLVSGVDILLNLRPSVFLEQVELSPLIEAAVMHRHPPLGPVLQTVVELEQAIALGDDTLMHQEASYLGLYNEAEEWVDDVMAALRSA